MADFSSSFVDLEQNLFDEAEVDVMSFLCGGPAEMDRACLAHAMDMDAPQSSAAEASALFGAGVDDGASCDANALLSAFLPASAESLMLAPLLADGAGSPSSSSPPSSPDAGESSPDVRSPLGLGGADGAFGVESFLAHSSSLLFGGGDLGGLCSSAQATISPSCLQPTIDLPQITEALDADADDDEDADDLEDPQDDQPKRKSASRKRKRQRKNDEPATKTAVTLPRKQLLKLSSKELDEYAERLRSVRTLSAAEEKDLRRQRRLIKNRESAQLSRQRRKVHMEDMQEQINQLAGENTRLKSHVQTLEIENAALKEKLRMLQRDPSSSSSSSPLVSTSNSESGSFLQMMRDLTTVKKPLAATGSAVTTTLMIVLLSFGLLFMSGMNGGFSAGPALAASRAGFLSTGNLIDRSEATVVPTFTSSFTPSPPSSSHAAAAATRTHPPEAVESNNFQAHKKMRVILQTNEDEVSQLGASPDRPIQIDDSDVEHKYGRSTSPSSNAPAYPLYESGGAQDAKELNASSEGAESLSEKASPLGGFLSSVAALRRTRERAAPPVQQQKPQVEVRTDDDAMDIAAESPKNRLAGDEAPSSSSSVLWCPDARPLPSLVGGGSSLSRAPQPGSTLTLLLNKQTAFPSQSHLPADTGMLQITCRVLDVSSSCAVQQGLVSCSQ